jgi:hypothetical protein
MAPAADFWTGWAAVRYLADEFRDRYDLERGLVAELHSYVAPVTAQRLAREGQRLFRLRLELDRLGRRRGTAAEMGDAARRLLEQLVFWLAEVEQAAAGITRDSLTLEGAELLAHMEAGRPAAA